MALSTGCLTCALYDHHIVFAFSCQLGDLQHQSSRAVHHDEHDVLTSSAGSPCKVGKHTRQTQTRACNCMCAFHCQKHKTEAAPRGVSLSQPGWWATNLVPRMLPQHDSERVCSMLTTFVSSRSPQAEPASLPTCSSRSSLSVQQMQPLASEMSFSSHCTSAVLLPWLRSAASMLSSAMSFTITATYGLGACAGGREWEWRQQQGQEVNAGCWVGYSHRKDPVDSAEDCTLQCSALLHR